LNLSI